MLMARLEYMADMESGLPTEGAGTLVPLRRQGGGRDRLVPTAAAVAGALEPATASGG
jgi:hypothetical protein